jgi:DNA-binding transcriptional ArsR family regulator
MVECILSLDSIFSCLADPIRRDILQRVAKEEMSVGEIAAPYKLTLAGVSKHLKILEKASLIVKRRWGKQQRVQLSPVAFKTAADYLKHYEKLWSDRLDSLEQYLASMPND